MEFRCSIISFLHELGSSMQKNTTKAIVSLALLLGSFALLYREVVVKLVRDWATDDNYSHGFLIVPIALYFIWDRRNRLVETVRRPSNLGLLVILGSLIVLLVGTLGSELFLTRISLLGSLIGTILFLCGWGYLRILAFPLIFLLLMIPIPRIVFDQVVFPLQLFASQLAEITLSLCGIPVLREGNLIVLANATLEVAEACSGIRSLVSLLVLATVYGYLMDSRSNVRVALAIGTVPVAIIANGFRVSGTGLAAQYYGPEAAEAFFDTFSGWILFIVAFILLFLLYRALLWIAPLKLPTSKPAAVKKVAIQSLELPAFGRALAIALAMTVVAIYTTNSVTHEAVALRESLAGLSMQLGEWRGKSAPKFDDKIIAQLGVDEYLSRFYYSPDRHQVHLYVGYYQSQRQADTIHSPKNCLPGAGWNPVKSSRVTIPVESGHLEVNQYVIQKGLDKQVVLYWYQSHGRVIASEYWAKIYLVLDSIRMNRSDGALVRVVSPILDSETSAEQQAVDFAKALFPPLNHHLPL
jgi:exosortase D (VPLPA-CTERM-specific)